MAVDGGCIFGPNVEAIQEADVSKCPGAPQKLITDGYSQGRERDNKFNIALQNVKHKTQDGLQENHMESWDYEMRCICFTTFVHGVDG